MEAICSSVKLGNLYRTTFHYNPLRRHSSNELASGSTFSNQRDDQWMYRPVVCICSVGKQCQMNVLPLSSGPS
jgi:hypothetical protein